MKSIQLKGLSLLAGLVMVVSSCAQAEAESTTTVETDEQKVSYSIGYNYVLDLQQQINGLFELDGDAFAKGALDALNANEQVVTNEEFQQIVMALQQAQMEKAQAEAAELSAAARAEGEAFMAENGEKEGVTTTESGLQYEVMVRGDSEERPTAESTVSVHYHGTLIDGTVFDSSVERGEPIDFPLNGVISGWTEGVQYMAVGDKFRFTIPADLAYGDRQASPKIPPGSTLIFEVELLDIL